MPPTMSADADRADGPADAHTLHTEGTAFAHVCREVPRTRPGAAARDTYAPRGYRST
jgi:hypothetical protein